MAKTREVRLTIKPDTYKRKKALKSWSYPKLLVLGIETVEKQVANNVPTICEDSEK